MKNLVNYITESLFDKDLVNKIAGVNGIAIDSTIWEQAIQVYNYIKKEYRGTKCFFDDADCEVLYNEDDCFIAIDEYENVYVLCPETVYVCYKAFVDVHGYEMDLTNPAYISDCEVSFEYIADDKKWSQLGYWGPTLQTKLKKAGFEHTTGYIPETISNKAKSIIKKYTK